MRFGRMGGGGVRFLGSATRFDFDMKRPQRKPPWEENSFLFVFWKKWPKIGWHLTSHTLQLFWKILDPPLLVWLCQCYPSRVDDHRLPTLVCTPICLFKIRHRKWTIALKIKNELNTKWNMLFLYIVATDGCERCAIHVERCWNNIKTASYGWENKILHHSVNTENNTKISVNVLVTIYFQLQNHEFIILF